jgi:tetratricopeptide (TPR) repeat protein
MGKMKSKIRSTIILVSLAGLLSSCFAPATMPIQVLRPAELSFPDSLISAGILNASLVESDLFSEEDSLWYTNKDVYLNNIASTDFSLELGDWLMFSPRFSNTHGIEVREMPPYEYLDTIPPPFAPQEMVELTADFDDDLLISVEYFRIQSITPPLGFSVNWNDPAHTVFSMYSDGVVKALKLMEAEIMLRIYHTETGLALNELFLRDSLLWLTSMGFSFNKEEISEEEIFFYGNTGRDLANKLSKKLAPWWKEEERVYFYGTKSEFSRAYFLALDNKWESVRLLMRSQTNHKRKRVAAHAWYNLAVSLEILGKIEEAHEALKNAAKIYPSTEISGYLKILENRVKEKELLDHQLGF